MPQYVAIAFAYVGIIVGAGLSSGQDLLQYFLSFGTEGILGVIAMGVMNIIFGRIIVTLGCYYQSDNHQEVFEKIAHPVIHRLIDITLVVSGFAMAFVMVAGAGANLEQQFGLPTWAGALLCSLLVIGVAFLDFEKITRVLGIFTPLIVLMILFTTAYTFISGSYDFSALDAAARAIRPAMPNVFFSAVNYYALCAATGVSMAFVLGGSVVRIGTAEKGGMLGGTIIGIIVTCAALTLFAHIDTVAGKEIPMLEIVNSIHPAFALVYALTIFALIFNTAFSLYYATAKRFAGSDTGRMRKILIGLVAVGYACSFGGFKALVGGMYPILGFMGILLIVVLAYAWLSRKDRIFHEKMLRRKMLRMMLRKIAARRKPTPAETARFHLLSEKSVLESRSLREQVKMLAKRIAAKHPDVKAYAEKHLPLHPDYREPSQNTSMDSASLKAS